jgi:hypothetical protein
MMTCMIFSLVSCILGAIAVHSGDHEYKGSESAVMYGLLATPLRAKCIGHRGRVEVFCGNGAGIHVAECRNAEAVVRWSSIRSDLGTD